MKLTKQPIYLIIFLIACITGNGLTLKAQDEKPSLDKGSIESRFNYVIQKSEDFEDFKMVKRWMIYRLKTYVLDSLKAVGEELDEAQNLVKAKDIYIDSLTNVIQSKNDNLSTIGKEKNSIRLVGLNMSKYMYNSIMWSIIILLAVFLLIFIIMFKRSNAITVKTKQALNDKKEEYDTYRKRALEREQKVVRELYDEILKYKNKSN